MFFQFFTINEQIAIAFVRLYKPLRHHSIHGSIVYVIPAPYITFFGYWTRWIDSDRISPELCESIMRNYHYKTPTGEYWVDFVADHDGELLSKNYSYDKALEIVRANGCRLTLKVGFKIKIYVVPYQILITIVIIIMIYLDF